MSEEEKDVLKGGITKYSSILRNVVIFLFFQIALAVIAPVILTVLTACSFIALMLGSAWYAISFQNVSMDQLEVGVADYITKRMFRGFILSFCVLPIGILIFLFKLLIPEIHYPDIKNIHLFIRIFILIGNATWVIIVWKDVYEASVAYDASDSLLGDGFPILLRGAKATAQNLPMLDVLKDIRDRLPKKKNKENPIEKVEDPDNS